MRKHPRNRLATEVSAQLLKHFGDKVYDTMIPRNVRLAEAPSFGVPVLLHDPPLNWVQSLYKPGRGSHSQRNADGSGRGRIIPSLT
jgi:cellulose biosynthesis protein BcsQ